MVYAFTQDVPIDDATYQKVMQKMADAPMPGLVVHLCVRREDGGLRYIDIWESEQTCEAAFENLIHPAVYAALAETNFVPNGEPTKQNLDVIDMRVG